MPNHGFRSARSIRLSLAAVLLLWFTTASAATFSSGLSAQEILRKASKPYELVNDYTADARLSVDSTTVHVSDMNVRIFYKRPNKVHLQARDGFAVLPKQGLILGNPVRELITASSAVLERCQSVSGRACYVVKGSVRRDGRSTRSAFWIDKKDFVIRRLTVNPEWGTLAAIDFQYSRTGGKYSLPSSTSAQVSVPPIESRELKTKGKLGPTATVRIVFQRYRINTGLSDSIFKDDMQLR